MIVFEKVANDNIEVTENGTLKFILQPSLCNLRKNTYNYIEISYGEDTFVFPHTEIDGAGSTPTIDTTNINTAMQGLSDDFFFASAGGGGGGDATAANQVTQIALLTSLGGKDFATETTLNLSVWTQIVGNSIEYSYYGGVVAGNPSGNTDNIETIVYKEGVTTIVTETLTYDANDNILTRVAS